VTVLVVLTKAVTHIPREHFLSPKIAEALVAIREPTKATAAAENRMTNVGSWS
jgi:hypothetical protein